MIGKKTGKYRSKGIYPYTGKLEIKKIYGFDCETEGKYNKLVLGSIVGEYKEKEVLFRFRTTQEFISIIKNNQKIFRNSYIFATNLGFDFCTIFENRYNHMLKKFKFVYQGGTMCYALCYMSYKSDDKEIYPEIPSGQKRDGFYKIYFIDSMNFFKMGVEKLGKIIGIEKMKYIPKLNKDTSWKKPETPEEWKKLDEYNINDSLITYKAMSYMQKSINTLGGTMKITASSTSLDIFRRRFLKYPILQPSREVILYLYKFYFGGRTECLIRGRITEANFGKINILDINSTYPFAMLDSFPMPTGEEKIIQDIEEYTIKRFEGVCRCRVSCDKKMYLPIIPVHSDKLLFPVGEFDCNTDFITLRKALSEGYKLIKIYDGVVFHRNKKPFKEYMKYLYSERKKYKKEKNVIMAEVTKLMMNSFYGKLGFRFDNKSQYFTEEKYYRKIKNTADKKEKELMLYEAEKNRDEYADGIYEIKTDENSRIPNHVNPIFAIYVTAKARLLLYNYIKPIQDRVLYMDTDSIFTDVELPESEEIGGLKKEDICSEITIIAPKCYHKKSILSGDKVRIKGVPNASIDTFNDIIQNRMLHYNKILKWKESVKRHLSPNELIKTQKLLSLSDNKRVWKRAFDLKSPIHSTPIILKGDDKNGEKEDSA